VISAAGQGRHRKRGTGRGRGPANRPAVNRWGEIGGGAQAGSWAIRVRGIPGIALDARSHHQADKLERRVIRDRGPVTAGTATTTAGLYGLALTSMSRARWAALPSITQLARLLQASVPVSAFPLSLTLPRPRAPVLSRRPRTVRRGRRAPGEHLSRWSRGQRVSTATNVIQVCVRD
jgi:hypothetical protein